MRDFDELIANLQNCAKVNSLSLYKRDLMKQAADAIEKLQKRVELEYRSGFADGQRVANRKKNKWISVEDRLPINTSNVLGHMAWGGISVVQFESERFFMQGSFSPLPNEAVTYWMPLPEPPKEE